jgi:hypothetical protein
MLDPKAPARPRKKTWAWFRKYNGFPYHPKWPMVAKRARVRTEVVVVIVLLLEEAANKGEPATSRNSGYPSHRVSMCQ